MKLKILASVLALSLVLVACAGEKKVEKKVEKKDSLILPTAAVRTLDTVKATDSASFNILSNTQEALLIPNDNKPVPGLAKSYTLSEDGKIYTFHLRENLKWHDGELMTSKDFLYAWQRLLDPKVGAGYAFFLFGVKNAKDYYLGKNGVKKEDIGLSTPDDLTFVVELNNPIPYFPQIVAFTGLAAQRADLVKKYGDTYGSAPERLAYNGPYVVKEWLKGNKITLEKNPNYWNAANIKIKNIKFMLVKEKSTQFQMFENGQLDVMEGGTGEYIQRLDAGVSKNKWKVQKKSSPSLFYISFNQAKQNLFKSIKIRLAMSLAVDRASYVKNILKTNIPAYGFVPAGINVAELEYRKEIKEPLKELGEKDLKALFVEGLKELNMDEDTSKYNFSILLQKNTAQSKIEAEFLKDLWEKKLGVKITLLPSADFSDFLQKLDAGDYDLAFQGWNADYNSPLTFLDLFTKDNGNNYGRYNNERVNSLVEELSSVQEPKKRLAMFEEIEKLYIVEDPANIPLYYKSITSYEKNFVKGLQLNLFGGKYQLRWLEAN